MRFKIPIFLSALGLVVLMYYCSPTLYVPVAADAEKTNTSLDTLLAGRKLYINNCGSCHALYLPERFTAIKWKMELDEMQKKARINDKQRTLIYKYLISKSL